MKSAALLLLIVTSALAEDPAPTNLTDREKVQMWEQIGEINKLFQEQKQLQEKLQAASKAWDDTLTEKRKAHNAAGCGLDVSTMHWLGCSKPDKAAVKK